jgi:putative transposase
MLVYEYKLTGSQAQFAAIDQAIRTTQFMRNKALRLWMDSRGVTRNHLQVLCATLAHEVPFAARLNSQARQAAADRAWAAISRFYENCRTKRPGKKGYPRFQRDCRSVEYKQTGWKLESGGKHLTRSDGCGIGRLKLVGRRGVETFPLEAIKRVRLMRRADGYYAQFLIEAVRRVEHAPTGTALGIDMGLHALVTTSAGQSVPPPQCHRKMEITLKRRQRQLMRKSRHPRHMKGRHKDNHAQRHVAKRNKYPAMRASVAPQQLPTGERPKPSANYVKTRRGLAKTHLRVSRQREDFARKVASALISSCDRIAYEDLQIRNLVRNHRLAKSIHDAGWGRLRHWVEYYARLHGIPAVAVPPQWTSQDCSGCGQRVHKSLSERTHRCVHCGLVLDRDENAAVNILQSAMNRTVGHTGT